MITDMDGKEIKLDDVVQFVNCPNRELIGAIGTVIELWDLGCTVAFYLPDPRLVCRVTCIPQEEVVRIGPAVLKFPRNPSELSK